MRMVGYVPPVAVLLIAGLAACGDRSQDPAPESTPAASPAAEAPELRRELLVQGDWLAENLASGDLVLLHVGGDEADFQREHIPGARFIPVSALVRELNGVPNVFPPRAEMANTFATAGVTHDAHVVVYGAPLAAARAFVALEHLGHRRVSLLDGGLAAWPAGDNAARPMASAPMPATGFRAEGGEQVIVDAAAVDRHRTEHGVALIDARPSRQFTGEDPGDNVPRPGHIPGARNLFWEELLVSTDQPRLRDEASLRSLFQANGADAGDTVITYCRTGFQASFAYFVARYLGYDAQMYDGSFVDWSPRQELPVARGPAAGI
jgi:thiosulfate/3-mercaptopyruvate sulfurtransferase